MNGTTLPRFRPWGGPERRDNTVHQRWRRERRDDQRPEINSQQVVGVISHSELCLSLMETYEEAELCFPKLLNASCQKPVNSQVKNLILHILLFIFSPMTVALNLLVIITVSHFRQLHTPTNLILLSLAVSDLLVGLVPMPGEVYLHFNCWFLGDLMCSSYNLITYVSVSASVGNMVLISIDRFIAICDPLHYTHKVTITRVKVHARAMRSHITAITAQQSVKGVANKSELKAARTLGVLVLVFLNCYCPYFGMLFTEDVALHNASFSYVTFLLHLNSCLNPLIYALLYPWFRKAIKLIFTLQILQPGSSETNIL
ncbi:trace amine-associated receptor 13c-like [Sphaeramia orbicularis]|uniref:trace amine-associated receptor 13c-like n=1 Tax=Sphaeramia orbicularis TaxID=375764 RepID=UPI00117D9B5C|nr:trace amine-associated receptor 13c-like [Sphaeramia orbicularis]